MSEIDNSSPSVTYILYFYTAEDILAELKKLAEPPDPPPQTYTTT